MSLTDNDWAALYRVLRLMGLPRPTVPCELGDHQVAVGWPELRMCLALDTDTDAHVFADAGWKVFVVASSAMTAVGPLLAQLDEMTFEAKLRRSAAEATQNISREEQELLRAMLRIGLPDPDRNFRVIDPADGRLITIPDFCWPDAKLAVYVDGWRWHVGLDLADDIAAAAAASKPRAQQLTEAVKRRDASDAAKRRWLTEHGWEHLVVHDTEMTGGPEVVEQVARTVLATYRRIRSAAA